MNAHSRPTARGPWLYAVAPLLMLHASCAPGIQARVANPTPSPTAPVLSPRLDSILIKGGVDPSGLRCRTFVHWDPNLDKLARTLTTRLAERWGVQRTPEELERDLSIPLGYLVRIYFEQARPDNLGVTPLAGRSFVGSDGKPRPILVFRSALTAQENGVSDCFRSLVHEGQVRHVINLYAGPFPFQDLLDGERALGTTLGVSYFDAREHADIEWRSLVEEEAQYEKNRDAAQRNLARLIRDQILRPGGTEPKGNIYLHCLGGMHRSGMVFGVLRRCINRDSMESIENEYKQHVGYISEKQPGGFEALNLRFIREFDCSLLSAPLAQ